MINIYAETFRTATRTNCLRVHDVVPAKRRRWFALGENTRCINPEKL